MFSKLLFSYLVNYILLGYTKIEYWLIYVNLKKVNSKFAYIDLTIKYTNN